MALSQFGHLIKWADAAYLSILPDLKDKTFFGFCSIQSSVIIQTVGYILHIALVHL